MLKTVLKKQLRERFAFVYMNGKDGKRRSTGALILYAAVMLYALGTIGMMFYYMATSLCAPLVEAGLDWLYFALMGTIATAFGVIGSVFTTYSGLYQAKDNELLLSMPIPPRDILFARMVSIYVMSLIFEALAMLPTALAYGASAPLSPAAVAFNILILFLLPLFALALSCILGWLIALLTARMKRKNLLSVALSIAFLAAYYYFYTQAYHYLQLILINSDSVGHTVRTALYPLYLMGLAATGSVPAFLGFALLVLAFFAVVYWVLSRSFLHLATMKRGAAKTRYEEKTLKVGSQDQALLRKEFAHFWSSPTYMLNCGLGAIILVAGAVGAVIKGQWLLGQIAKEPRFAQLVPLLVCGAVGLITCMNVVTAPSVSLEGKSLWLAQSLPVSGWQVLRSKLKVHVLVSGVPAMVFLIAAEAIMKPEFFVGLLLPVFTVVFILLCAAIGLVLNLKMPNLNWTNETVPVKQSMSVVLAIFAGWAALAVLAVLAVLAMKVMSMGLAMLLATVAAALIAAWLLAWLKRGGVRILASL